MRKRHKDHLFYILVPMELLVDEFYLRVYHSVLEEAPRSEYRMKIDKFLEHNKVYKQTRDNRYDVIRYTFEKIYISTINYKSEV